MLTLREENLIWRVAHGDQKVPLIEWATAISKIAWEIHAGQGVELEVPAEPVVPYLDHN